MGVMAVRRLVWRPRAIGTINHDYFAGFISYLVPDVLRVLAVWGLDNTLHSVEPNNILLRTRPVFS